jgi:hypothetical protein
VVIPEISKSHDMILESKCSPNRKHKHTKVEQHNNTHRTNETPNYRFIDREPATAI